MDKKNIMMFAGGLVLLIIVIIVGMAIFGGDSKPAPAPQPANPVQPTVPQPVQVPGGQSVQTNPQASQRPPAITSSQEDPEQINPEEEITGSKANSKKTSSASLKKGVKKSWTFSVNGKTWEEFYESHSDIFSELEAEFHELVELEQEKIQRKKDEQEAKKNETKEDRDRAREEKKEEDKILKARFQAYRNIPENYKKETSEYNRLFDDFVSGLSSYSLSMENDSSESVITKLKAAFEEEREEINQKLLDKNSNAKVYDPEDEANKNSQAEIQGLPCDFVDKKFASDFQKFAKGNSKRVQPIKSEINPTVYGGLTFTSSSLVNVEKTVKMFREYEFFNRQLLRELETFRTHCFYDHKGSLTFVSFYQKAKVKSSGEQQKNIFDELKVLKPVYQQVELFVTEQHKIAGIINYLKHNEEESLYLEKFDIRNLVYPIHPLVIEETVIVQIPIYIGESPIKLDSSDPFDEAILKSKGIREEDFEKLRTKNLKEFRSQLISAGVQALPADHMYFEYQANLQASAKLLTDKYLSYINKEESEKDYRKFSKFVSIAAQNLKRDLEEKLYAQQLV